MAFTADERIALLRTLAPYVDTLNAIKTAATTLADREAIILQRHATYGATDSAENVEETIRSVGATLRAAALEVIAQCRRVMVDKNLVVANLAIPPTAGFDDIVRLLTSSSAALADIDDTLEGTVTGVDEVISTRFNVLGKPPASASVPFSSGTRSGPRLILYAETDGVTAPSNTVLPSINNLGRVSQAMKIPGENVFFQVTADSELGGRVRGQESFSIFSTNTGTPYSGKAASSGSVGNVSTAHALGEALIPSSLLFPPFTVADIPDGWTVVGGTAGTQFSEDDTNTFRGASSIALAANATFELSKTFPAAALTRNMYYALYWWERSTAQGVPEPAVDDTPALDPATEGLGSLMFTKVYPSSGAAGLQPYSSGASWRLRWKIYRANGLQPAANLTIKIKSTGTNTAGSITGIGLAPISYYGGFGYLIVPGNTDPLVTGQPLFSLTVACDTWITDEEPDYYIHGRWSEFFAQALGVQLPTNSGSEIGDDPSWDQLLGPPVTDGEDLDTVPDPDFEA